MDNEQVQTFEDEPELFEPELDYSTIYQSLNRLKGNTDSFLVHVKHLKKRSYKADKRIYNFCDQQIALLTVILNSIDYVPDSSD